jgi:uracil-DNA glycosylase
MVKQKLLCHPLPAMMIILSSSTTTIITNNSFHHILLYIVLNRNSHTVYPPPHDTFTALNSTPLSKVKVVIVGQDPYHGPNQAHGLCFSLHRGQTIPPSLRNIYKELMNDNNNNNNNNNFPSFIPPQHGCLERWAQQGVLLINTVWTVRKGEPNSHQKKGWEEFTDAVIRAVVEHHHHNNNKGVVFLLWGKPANHKLQTALAGSGSGKNGKSSSGSRRHPNVVVISTSHPSPLGATKTNSPFLGSKCFSRANAALRTMGHSEIDWNVDGPLPVSSSAATAVPAAVPRAG